MYFSFFTTESAKYPKGKKVINAISLAMIMEPMKVMVMRSRNRERKFPATVTSFRAKMVKNRMFRSAQITARVKNRHDRVFQSK